MKTQLTPFKTPKFQVGDLVRKVGGSYQAPGIIKAVFSSIHGDIRYVFEFVEPAGMLHIFNEEQLDERS